MTYRIAVIAGDGIGPEVIAEGIKAIEALTTLQEKGIQFEFVHLPWGCEYYLREGRMMPEDGMDVLLEFDAIYLGAVGYPGVPDHVSLWDLLLIIRKQFDQYINLRPIRLLNGAPTVLKEGTVDNIQMTFIRENTEGEYAGAGEWLYRGQPQEVALQTGVFSRHGTERVMRYAFELARREKKTLTSISKGNALQYSMVFWDELFEEIAKDYPDVTTYSYLVDAAAMHMINDPGRFEIVVTSNLFGDIMTDIGAAIAGGMGLAAGANINPERAFPSMFEPVHGSAPDIAGQGKANPLAAIWSASQMLDHFDLTDEGAVLIQAIEHLLVEGEVLTPDLGGDGSTSEVGNRIAQLIQTIQQSN